MKKYILKFYGPTKDEKIRFFPSYNTIEHIEMLPEKMDSYIATKRDFLGFPFMKVNDQPFDYVSQNNAIIIKEYVEPEFDKFVSETTLDEQVIHN